MKRLILLSLLIPLAIIPALALDLTLVINDREDFPQLLGNGREFQSEQPGIAVDILRDVAARLDLNLTLRRMPWTRALEIQVNKGRADGAFFASYKPAREAFGVYPLKDGSIDDEHRYGRTAYYFYKLHGSDVQ
jgi:polar amino acid transport system substrate-binding protein